VLDLGVRLDATRAPTTEGSILLVRLGEHVAGLVVSEVVDVRGIAVDETTPSANEGITRGIATVDGAAVVVLDLDALLVQVLRF
jgi:chemotaxis signal transduction protein